MRPFVLVALVAALQLLIVVVASAEPEPATRANFKLPSLFNFAQFKSSFHKHYGSFVEELVRQKIFLGRAVQAFVSLVKYNHFKVSSFLSVNHRSDQTPSELKASYVPIDRLISPEIREQYDRKKLEKSDEEEEEEVDMLDEVEEIPVANPDEITSQLNFVEQHSQEPGYREIAQELQKQQAEGAQYKIRAKEISEAKEEERVPSNNPSYQQHPSDSIRVDEKQEPRESLPARLVSVLSSLPGASYVRNSVNEAARKLAKVVASDEEEMEEEDEDEDEVYADLRESGCLGPVKTQGRCGACYAFTGIAIYEYIYCLATGKRVSFSEQYIVSCGHRKKMLACDGGTIDLTASFVDTYGLELARDFPYLDQDGTCPYDDQTPSRHMGYVKPLETGFKLLHLDNFGHYLEERRIMFKDQVVDARRPIMFGFFVSGDFDFYGGGVHEPSECSPDDGHGMAVVGHGRQEGQEYWLMRNSYGPDWGERGYYKISKEALKKCLDIEWGVVSTARFGRRDREHINPINRRLLGGKRRLKEEEDDDHEDEPRRPEKKSRRN